MNFTKKNNPNLDIMEKAMDEIMSIVQETTITTPKIDADLNVLYPSLKGPLSKGGQVTKDKQVESIKIHFNLQGDYC